MGNDKSGIITAIIVSYNPDMDRFRALIDSVVPQANHVVVVDNGSSGEILAFLRDLAQQKEFKLIEFGRNKGIAVAHNAGISNALGHGHDYVLLLDHDSLLMPGCVEQLLSAHRILSNSGVPVAAVGPRYLDETSGVQAPFLRFGRWDFLKIYCNSDDEIIESSVLISSGSLISSGALRAIGLMDETLFIDGVDWEWCFRASSRGFRLFGIAAASMLHSLGDSGIRIMGWKVPLHSPLRHYYVYRNAVLLCKRTVVPFSWKFHFSIRLIIRFAIYMVLAPRRLERCRYIFRGLLDGMRNRSGQIMHFV